MCKPISRNGPADAVRLGDASISGDHAALDHNRTADGIDDAREFDERPITSGLNDAAVASRDRWVNKRATMGFQRAERADFVDTHQPAVPDNIRGKNGRQPALDGVAGVALQGSSPNRMGGR
jgi:hypothetical protein